MGEDRQVASTESSVTVRATNQINGFKKVAKFSRYILQCGRIIDHPYGGSHMWEVWTERSRIGVAYDEPTALAMWQAVVSTAMQDKMVDVDAKLPA